jgi:hypothetical protein
VPVREFVVLGTASQAPTRTREEAAAVFSGELVVAADLGTVPVPRRG